MVGGQTPPGECFASSEHPGVAGPVLQHRYVAVTHLATNTSWLLSWLSILARRAWHRIRTPECQGTGRGRLLLAGQLERVCGLQQVVDRDSDGIGASAFMVVVAGVLFDPALEILQAR